MICTMLHFVRSVSGMLNNMFVSGLCGLVSLPFYPQLSHSLQYVYALVCRSHAFARCCTFPKFLLVTFLIFPCWSLSLKILPVFSKGALHHWYIIAALTIIIYDNIICFYVQPLADIVHFKYAHTYFKYAQTLEMCIKLHIIS